MNIKQFNQPTLNHSDSFTLPTNLCLHLSSSVLPSSPPHFLFFKHSLPPLFSRRAAHACAHACREAAEAQWAPRGAQGWRPGETSCVPSLAVHRDPRQITSPLLSPFLPPSPPSTKPWCSLGWHLGTGQPCSLHTHTAWCDLFYAAPIILDDSSRRRSEWDAVGCFTSLPRRSRTAAAPVPGNSRASPTVASPRAAEVPHTLTSPWGRLRSKTYLCARALAGRLRLHSSTRALGEAQLSPLQQDAVGSNAQGGCESQELPDPGAAPSMDPAPRPLPGETLPPPEAAAGAFPGKGPARLGARPGRGSAATSKLRHAHG